MVNCRLALLACVIAASSAFAADDEVPAVATNIREIDAKVLPATENASDMLYRDIRRRLMEANQRESAAWRNIKTIEDWQAYVRPRMEAMQKKLGIPPLPEQPPKFHVTRKIEGDGYLIRNLVYESLGGTWVTANLYSPRESNESVPAILISHSHHAPKTQGELQDMGITWARQGAVVLVIDLPGHGERRQHDFVDDKSYPGSFRASRQDYYFRYNLGQQLPLVGQSLMGWMVNDLRRGIDLVTSLPGVDKSRIALLGAVAGGGDPCAVTAAVDKRITLAAPFNFGGPQPETKYPLPDDAETSFNYAGGGSWESTRNLQFSAAEGFLPWVIVGSIAPRGLVYGHEFNWDQPRDPVWKRLETLFGLHDARDRLSFAHGRGSVRGQAPESTHCTNVGPVHRERIHLALRDWFKLSVPEKESSERRPAEELHSMTPETRQRLSPRKIHEAIQPGIAAAIASQEPPDRRAYLIDHWKQVLGDVEPASSREVSRQADETAPHVDRIVLETETGIHVPLLLLLPDREKHPRPAVVIGVAQAGKEGFLKHRAETIARLLETGNAVCLPDLRGMGETRPGDGRGRTSAATSLSASAWMLGRTMLGWRLKDLRSVCQWLQMQKEVDGARLVLWGESFIPANDPQRKFAAPWDADDLPRQSEPGGALLALFGGLFEDNVRGVYGCGGLESYASVLNSPYVYVPHDALVPFALTKRETDVNSLTKAIAPRLIKMEAAVDGINRQVGAAASNEKELAEWLATAARRIKED